MEHIFLCQEFATLVFEERIKLSDKVLMPSQSHIFHLRTFFIRN